MLPLTHPLLNRLSTPLLPSPRIINGISAPLSRYPYSVSLRAPTHFCGASLVAPDMILTAAHCGGIQSEVVIDSVVYSVTTKIRHPNFNEDTVDNDFLLMVLDGMAEGYVRLNEDPSVPAVGEELTVMGWGDVDPDDVVQITSDELMVATVGYLDNEECEKSEGWVDTEEGMTMGYYEGGITDNMMCAVDDVGEVSDACQGDSGGALVVVGEEEDVQVGIVSWGFGCADAYFPGVYSRISSQYDWLRETICEYSASPPEYLECGSNESDLSQYEASKAPTLSPIGKEESKGLLTVFVETDPLHPEELGWELSSLDGVVIDSRSIGFYAEENQEAFRHEVVVEPENFYKLTIFDEKADGFLGYMAVVKGKNYIVTNVLVLEPGFSSVSGESVTHSFYVGTDPPRTLSLDITFDDRPAEIAWSVTNVNDNLELGFKWFGWYGNLFPSIIETIPIYGDDRGSQKYTFEMIDSGGDGICCEQGSGSYSLYLGPPEDGILIASGGSFTTEEFIAFEVSSSGSVTLSSAIAGTFEYYLVPDTGLCSVHDKDAPSWITTVFSDYDECCDESWNRQECIDARPSDAVSSSPSTGGSDNKAIEFSPVTGSYTCSKAGLACTISCSGCGSIIRQASGMTMNFANKSTIVYTASEDYSQLVLVETDGSSLNSISCEEGCTCSIVNQDSLGCGRFAESQGVTSSDQNSSSQQYSSQEDAGCSRHALSSLIATGFLVLLMFS